MADVISWRVPSYFKGVNATKVEREISALDAITPRNIVEYARDEKSELHKCFEWDDTIAAQKHREYQARQILSQIVVKHVEDDKEKLVPVRVFVNTKRNTKEYKNISFVIQDRDEYELLVERARKELVSFVQKYETISEFSELCKIIKQYL